MKNPFLLLTGILFLLVSCEGWLINTKEDPIYILVLGVDSIFPEAEYYPRCPTTPDGVPDIQCDPWGSLDDSIGTSQFLHHNKEGLFIIESKDHSIYTITYEGGWQDRTAPHGSFYTPETRDHIEGNTLYRTIELKINYAILNIDGVIDTFTYFSGDRVKRMQDGQYWPYSDETVNINSYLDAWSYYIEKWKNGETLDSWVENYLDNLDMLPLVVDGHKIYLFDIYSYRDEDSLGGAGVEMILYVD